MFVKYVEDKNCNITTVYLFCLLKKTILELSLLMTLFKFHFPEFLSKVH